MTIADTNKITIKDVFEKAGLLSKAAECLNAAKSIYHEHFADEIKSDEKYTHISKEIDEVIELLKKETAEFNAQVEDLTIFKKANGKNKESTKLGE